jgi:excisionase family DNA binding protein
VSLLDEGRFRELVESAVRKVLREERARAARAPDEDDVFLSIAEAARLASVAGGTIRAWVKAGKLHRYGAGERVVRVRRSELLAFLERAGNGSPSDEAYLSPEQLADRDHARGRQRTVHRGQPRQRSVDTYESGSGDDEDGSDT